MDSNIANALGRITADSVERASSRLETRRTSKALVTNRQEIERLLMSFAEGSAFSVERLKHLKTERRTEQRRLLAEPSARAIETALGAESDRIEGLRLWQAARSLLSPQTQAGIITLDAPFEISLPVHNRPVDFSKNIEPFNSFARLHIDTNSGSDNAVTIFFFMWQNPSQGAVVIDVLTLLRFNGICQVEADSGFFSGHNNLLDVHAALALFRFSGWGTDSDGNPLDGTKIPVFDGTTFQSVSSLDVQGGSFLDPPELKRDTLNSRPVGLDAELIVVPAGASVLIQVQAIIGYAIEDGGDFDEALVDFADDSRGWRVTCPFVKLELLTLA